MTSRNRSILLGVAAGLVLTVLAVVALLVIGVGSGDDDQVVRLDEPGTIATAQDVAGKAAPGDAFTYFDGTDGSLADFKGSPLVVNFFAEWCAPCKKELPAFQAVHEQVGDAVTFVGMNTNDEESKGRALAEKVGLTYTLASDPLGDLLTAVGGIRMPATVFISPEGRILETKLGELTEAELLEKLRQHFPGAVT